MNSEQIKQAKRDGNSNWEILQMCVSAGREFPDAQFAVSRALQMDDDEIAEMVDAYDNCA